MSKEFEEPMDPQKGGPLPDSQPPRLPVLKRKPLGFAQLPVGGALCDPNRPCWQGAVCQVHDHWVGVNFLGKKARKQAAYIQVLNATVLRIG